MTECTPITIALGHVVGKLSCTVCCEEYKIAESVLQLSCGHMFHKDCINTWLSYSSACPNCRCSVGEGIQYPVLDTRSSFEALEDVESFTGYAVLDTIRASLESLVHVEHFVSYPVLDTSSLFEALEDVEDSLSYPVLDFSSLLEALEIIESFIRSPVLDSINCLPEAFENFESSDSYPVLDTISLFEALEDVEPFVRHPVADSFSSFREAFEDECNLPCHLNDDPSSDALMNDYESDDHSLNSNDELPVQIIHFSSDALPTYREPNVQSVHSNTGGDDEAIRELMDSYLSVSTNNSVELPILDCLNIEISSCYTNGTSADAGWTSCTLSLPEDFDEILFVPSNTESTVSVSTIINGGCLGAHDNLDELNTHNAGVCCCCCHVHVN